MSQVLERPLQAGELVDYRSPDWGFVRGKVIAVFGDRVLCQDLSENGGREYWPLAELRPLCRGSRWEG